jgi:hypothetical protein
MNFSTLVIISCMTLLRRKQFQLACWRMHNLCVCLLMYSRTQLHCRISLFEEAKRLVPNSQNQGSHSRVFCNSKLIGKKALYQGTFSFPETKMDMELILCLQHNFVKKAQFQLPKKKLLDATFLLGAQQPSSLPL